MNQKDVIILSVPYCKPFPLVAPVLLAGCLEQAGITSQGIDFSILFLEKFNKESWFSDFHKFLTMGHIIQPRFNRQVVKKILRFTKKFLLDIQEKYQPKTIGLSIFTSDSLNYGLFLSYLIRRYLPGVKIIAGGKGLEVTGTDGIKHYQTWIDAGVVDLIVVGDAESSIITAVKEDAYGLHFSPPQTKDDLDNIPLAKWDQYDLNMYDRLIDHNILPPYLSITGSKGCVRNCTFCDVNDFWPDYLYRDPIKVADEMIHNYEHTGIKNFTFTDNLINGSIKNFRRMNERIVERMPNTLNFSGYAIIRGKREMPEDDFALAAKAGSFNWSIGIESGSEKIRYETRKKFTNDDLDWCVNMLCKYGISQTWLLIVGYPSETKEDFEETLAMVRRYAHLAPTKKINIQFTDTFMLLNNSPLLKDRELAEFYGLDHIKKSELPNDKFWTSTKFIDNTFPERTRRYRMLVDLVDELGYPWSPAMMLKKEYKEELDILDQLYHEKTSKIIPIHPAK